MANIHPTAQVDSGAQLDSAVSIGPYSIIGPHVKIGSGTIVGPHCVIEGHTTIGQDNRIFQFNSLGAIPQDKKYLGEPCELRIGDRNVIREFCTFNIGCQYDLGYTQLGSDNWIMAYCHLAHDCVVGNHTIFANNSQLAGHVLVGDWAILGGFTNVHQFVQVGAHSMTGIQSVLLADLPPFIMCMGSPARARSMNFEGLKRRSFSPERIAAIRNMYKLIYRSNLTIETVCAELALQTDDADANLMKTFLENAAQGRGIVR